MLPAPTTIAISSPDLVDRRDLAGDPLDPLGIGAVRQRAHQRLARELQQDPIEGPLVSHSALLGDLPGRVSILLADHEASEAGDHDVLAGRGRGRGPQLLDRLAVVLVGVDVDLLEQSDLLAPLGELALDDLLADVLGLALLGRLLLEDRALGRLGLARNLVGGDVLRAPPPRCAGRSRGRTPGSRRCGRRSRSRTGSRPARRSCRWRGCRRRPSPRRSSGRPAWRPMPGP